MNNRLALSLVFATCLCAGSVVAGTIDENKALVSKFIEADNFQDFETLPTYLTEDFTRHSEATPHVALTGRDQFVAHMKDGVHFFLDTKYNVDHMVAEGDRVAVWASYQGGVAGRGVDPRIDVDVSMVYRIAGDKIAELWVMWDNNALRDQLDAHGRTEKN